MAQRVQVLLIDDLDGSEGAETVSFSLDGVSYEIDLSEKNATKLRNDFATWVGNGRKVGRMVLRGGDRLTVGRVEFEVLTADQTGQRG